MAQFDVHRNTGTTRRAFPYFVIIQSREFDETDRRLVIPLTSETSFYPSIVPRLVVDGRSLVADALLTFPVPVGRLGAIVTSLADDESAGALINALDRVVTRAFG